MAYCLLTKKQSLFNHGRLFSNQETKPLGSWHTVHQPRNKATWVMAYCSQPRNKATWVMAYCLNTKKQSHLGHGSSKKTKPFESWQFLKTVFHPSKLAIDDHRIPFIHPENYGTPECFWGFVYFFTELLLVISPLAKHQPRNKATWVMAYCSSTKKQSHLGHGILFINYETKPLGSWHTDHQPRNKATWVMAYCS